MLRKYKSISFSDLRRGGRSSCQLELIDRVHTNPVGPAGGLCTKKTIIPLLSLFLNFHKIHTIYQPLLLLTSGTRSLAVNNEQQAVGENGNGVLMSRTVVKENSPHNHRCMQGMIKNLTI